MLRGDSQRLVPDTRSEPLTLGFVARATLLVILLWALANALWLGRDVVLVTLLAVLVALFLSAFVELLVRRGVPRALAAVLVLCITLAVLTGLVVLAWPTLMEQLGTIRRQLPEAVGTFGEWAEARLGAVAGATGEADRQLRDQVRSRLNREIVGIMAGALPMLNTVVGAVLGLFVVVFAGFFVAIEPQVYVNGLTRLLPRSGRARTGEAIGEVGLTLRRWMLGVAIDMLIVGTVTTLGLWALGIPAALGLGLLAGLLEFIPYYGPLLSAVPAIAVAFVLSPAKALWVAVLYLVIQQIEGNVLHPLIMRRAVELPPALTILFQAVMAVLFGVLGLLLAVPVLAAGMVLVERLYVEEVADER